MTAGDLRLLTAELRKRRGDRSPQPLMLKIETTLAVRNLPRLIVQAGAHHPVAVMIERDDAIPPLDSLLGELDIARQLAAAATLVAA